MSIKPPDRKVSSSVEGSSTPSNESPLGYQSTSEPESLLPNIEQRFPPPRFTLPIFGSLLTAIFGYFRDNKVKTAYVNELQQKFVAHVPSPNKGAAATIFKDEIKSFLLAKDLSDIQAFEQFIKTKQGVGHILRASEYGATPGRNRVAVTRGAIHIAIESQKKAPEKVAGILQKFDRIRSLLEPLSTQSQFLFLQTLFTTLDKPQQIAQYIKNIENFYNTVFDRTDLQVLLKARTEEEKEKLLKLVLAKKDLLADLPPAPTAFSRPIRTELLKAAPKEAAPSQPLTTEYVDNLLKKNLKTPLTQK